MQSTVGLHKQLKAVFGYETFRDQQKEVMESIISGRDTVVIMPTGQGKSLCYQLPATLQEGLVLVVSPLIALMKNQVDDLHRLGIAADLYSASLAQKTVKRLKEAIDARQLKLLYISPESLNKGSTSLLQDVKLAFVAVDEAHCISDWGHDFRPEYRRLSSTIARLGSPPIMALTATATTRVTQDIIHSLAMRNARVFKLSFARDNLYYEVRPKVLIERQIVQFIKPKTGQTGIVYCQSRKKVEEVAQLLRLNQINVVTYHAGLDAKTRSNNQDTFLQQKGCVMVATIAFGMGIDKPDVRFLVHYDPPRSLEHYYQETGRAGRDGKLSTCVLFYDPEDIAKMRRFTNKLPKEQVHDHFLLQEIQDYLLSGACRKRHLLMYFGESYPRDCDCCDNCRYPGPSYPGKEVMHLLLKTMQDAGNRLVMDDMLKVVLRADDLRAQRGVCQKIPVLRRNLDDSNRFWRSVLQQALMMGFVHKIVDTEEYLALNHSGVLFLNEPYALPLALDHTYDLFIQQCAGPSKTYKTHLNDTYAPTLHYHLKRLVQQQSATKDPVLAAYTPQLLRAIAKARPTSLDELAAVADMGMDKARELGLPAVQLVKKYTENHPMDGSTKVVLQPHFTRFAKTAYLVQQLDKQMDLQAIADHHKMTLLELIEAMEKITLAGIKLNLKPYLEAFLTEEQCVELEDYFTHAGTNLDLALREFQDEVDEVGIRLARMACLDA